MGLMIPTTYEYKIFRAGVYLGSLPDVSSEFSYSLDINNGSAPMTIICNVPVVTSSESTDTIDTEDGQVIQAEDGSNLQIESTPVVFGPSTSGLLIANDNEVNVYEFSDDYPNGKMVYEGWITKWHKSSQAGNITIQCISFGMDLNDYVLQTGTSFVAEITQASGTDHSNVFGYNGYQVAQTFNPASSFAISKIQVYSYLLNHAFGDQTAKLELYSGTPGSASVLIGTTTYTFTDTTPSYKDFIFSTPLNLTSGIQYYFVLSNITRSDINATIRIYDDNSNPYASGESWFKQPTTWNIASTNDLRFIVYSVDDSVVSPYTSTDPTTIFESIISDYHGRGGKVQSGGTDLTGLSVSYTFNFSRTLNAVKKSLDLAPADFYWTVDPATSFAYFKQFNSTTPDIVLTLGINIEDLSMGVNAESVRNIFYFTGGDTGGGTNLFRKYTNPTSLASVGRPRLEDQTDNRVTLSATADAISNAFLDSAASEIYETTVSIPRGAGIDITTILPGQTVGFSGFGTFEDGLVLNIVRIQRYSDRIDCNLGSIPPRATSILRELENNIIDVQTVNNPSSPS